MKVYFWDLLAYGRHFDEYKAYRFLPYPLPKTHYDPEVAARTYEKHLRCWEELDRRSFDGVGLNEYHTTPHGLMDSPHITVAAAD